MDGCFGKSPSQTLFSVLLTVVPLLVLGYLSFERKRLDKTEIKERRKEKNLEKYREWISRGELPDLDVEASIDIVSLRDLVDLAIDLDRRVIYDESKALFYVLHENILYIYSDK